jgi:hypothetical protein
MFRVMLKRMASGHTGNDAATPEIPEENSSFQECAALGAARNAGLDKIAAAWPSLPDAIRRAMLALIG